VPLPDLSRLDAAPACLAGALSERLREVGFGRAHVDGLTELLPGLPTGLQHQGLDWLTLDDRRPASLALRLLKLGRTLALADAQELLVTALLQSLIEAGLLIKVQHGLRFPLRLELVNQLMVVSDRHDHDPATVMAVGGSTQLLARAGYPQYRPGPGLRQRPAGIAVGAGLPPRGGHRYQPARTAAGALQRGAQRYRQRRVAPGAPVRTRGRGALRPDRLAAAFPAPAR